MQSILNTFKKWFLLILIVVFLIFFVLFDLNQYLDFNLIKSYQHVLREWTNEHYFITVCSYIAIFTILIASTIPCATVLTLLGGFLFGPIAIAYAIFGTTAGGLILLLAVRSSIGSHVASRKTGWIKRLESGFQNNAFFYLLTMRLMPVAPCWMSNIAAGALNVPIRIFLTATILGITPATIVYVFAGRGLHKIFSSNTPPDAATILSPSILAPLIGLALLSLFPVLYKKLKKKSQSS